MSVDEPTRSASRSNAALELVTLAGVVALLGALAIAIATPLAEHYEISVYGAFPAVFWVLLAGAYFLGEMVIFRSAQREGDPTWRPALYLVLLANATLISMPYIRGYPMYGRADALTHLGFARDISILGGVPVDNIYPSTHVLVRTLSYLTGTDLTTFAVLVPIAFSGVYFGAMYFLLVHMYGSREEVLFRLPFVMLPVLGVAHVGVRPFDLSLLVVPLVFYLFVKGQRNPTPALRVTFVLATVAAILFHPLNGLFLVATFGFWGVARRIPLLRSERVTPTNVVSLTAVCFIAWYQNFASILIRFESVLAVLLGQREGSAPVEQYSETVNEASPPLVDLFQVWLFRFGVEFVVFSLGFGFLCLVLVFLYRDWYSVNSYVMLFAGLLVGFSFGGLFFLLFDFIVGMDRPFQYAKIGGVVLAGGVFYLVRQYVDFEPISPRTEIGFNAVIASVLLVLVLVSVFSFYPAPYGKSKNFQVTEQELEGTEWTAGNGTADDIRTIGINYRRFHDAHHGTVTERSLLDRGPPPAHFNYTTRRQLGQNYQEDTYLAVARLGRVVYPKTFPDYRRFWRFTPRDFDSLERDETVSRVYDNGDYDLYLVEGTASPTNTTTQNDASP